MMRRDTTDQRAVAGFTLVEVMVAMVVVAFIVSAVYIAMIQANSMLKTARYRAEAGQLAFDETWAIFNLNYEILQNLPAVTTRAVPTNSLLYPIGGTIRTGVVPVSNVCEIIVRVDWQQPVFGMAPAALNETYSITRVRSTR